ncbi:ribonuclease HII [Campylobacter blaseri]|uniref:Ribonuclease n=1 Tax=Campylobacter blaseri TaxID=2042961 RepID=A0A2P8R3U8_9BACT|nr:ribonuclease HII [Campylobacter blaseri]PSM53153.1 ribonuclease HII [Campylobacter blaseri]PSM54619.1 ribonuclease HII [Campylobacter blaseri]QKF86904.1 ribonuclease HII [Campylobacter blaseri]
MICGIDEAGRGCLAGDLCIVGCVLKSDIKGLNDSKKLSQKRRNELFRTTKENSFYKIATFTSIQVDELGLSSCINKGLTQIVEYFKKEFGDVEFIFDGNSKFGVSELETMIKADSKIKEVSAASILAKVTRDENLKIADELYPNFEFLKHKGYATKNHIELIKKYGYTEFHRKSYKVKALEKSLFTNL